MNDLSPWPCKDCGHDKEEHLGKRDGGCFGGYGACGGCGCVHYIPDDPTTDPNRWSRQELIAEVIRLTPQAATLADHERILLDADRAARLRVAHRLALWASDRIARGMNSTSDVDKAVHGAVSAALIASARFVLAGPKTREPGVTP